MPNPINTIPIQQFIQQVKAAELSHQKEIRLDMKAAKSLVYCLSELNTKLVQDYDELLSKIHANQEITIKMDGGSL